MMFTTQVPHSENFQNIHKNLCHNNDGTFSLQSYTSDTFNENDARIVTFSSDREKVTTLEPEEFIALISDAGCRMYKEAMQFQNMLLKIAGTLAKVKVYLVGEFIIDAVVAGQSASGTWVILQTQLFES